MAKSWYKSCHSLLGDLLLESDKKDIFNSKNLIMPGYSTGLINLDYANGYIVKPRNGKKEAWQNLGIHGGAFYTIVGNTNVGKTALAVKILSNMIRPFPLGDVFHNDAEGTSNPIRIQELNRFTDEEMERYHMMDIPYVEDNFEMIAKLAQFKLTHKEFMMKTGLYDMEGNEIIVPQPTGILIDSQPSLQTKDTDGSLELGSQTYNMRLAIAIGTFYKRLRPIIKKANIAVFIINHIKEKPQMGIVKKQAKIQLLNPDENIPGGSAGLYYSQSMLRLRFRGQFTFQKHGFDGFLVECEFLKSKTNRSGTKIEFVYDYETGFDEWLTLLHYAQKQAVIHGRNPYCYFDSDPSLKFNSRTFREAIKDDKLREVMMKDLAPSLVQMISKNKINPKDDCNVNQIMESLYDGNVTDENYEIDEEEI